MSYCEKQFSARHLKKVSKGITLYNSGHFWECHEELEEHWLEDMGDDCRYVYWVIIQLATAMLHWRDGNLSGAKGMIKKAKEKLLLCESKKVESDIMYKFLGWRRLKTLVFQIPEEPNLEDFDYLSKFKFSNPLKWDQHLDEE